MLDSTPKVTTIVVYQSLKSTNKVCFKWLKWFDPLKNRLILPSSTTPRNPSDANPCKRRMNLPTWESRWQRGERDWQMLPQSSNSPSVIDRNKHIRAGHRLVEALQDKDRRPTMMTQHQIWANVTISREQKRVTDWQKILHQRCKESTIPSHPEKAC